MTLEGQSELQKQTLGSNLHIINHKWISKWWKLHSRVKSFMKINEKTCFCLPTRRNQYWSRLILAYLMCICYVMWSQFGHFQTLDGSSSSAMRSSNLVHANAYKSENMFWPHWDFQSVSQKLPAHNENSMHPSCLTDGLYLILN